ncbi:F0F1 ATP synthase subunit B [Candidatus Liberibacter sp.]|uniref:F0F1 ATP synthase subunit B family protein n=1 Tax=Candidatus Liberibacter sp. TaxID=34022 RepID=UPI0015F71861|nr:F0F1 ATP synthase subunit B [Candidatus Liberibacter sp.]MBA5724488.1 F0F1 ATP synthase subunit B [Candidatus Liberibacter sp.]
MTYLDETFLAFVALVVFISVLVYLRVPSILLSFLDSRADRIRNELFEARRSCKDAEILLAQYKEKYSQVEQEVQKIIKLSEHRIEALEAENRQIIEEIFASRLAAVERNIRSAESEVMRSFYSKAADISIEISKKIIFEKIDSKLESKIFQKSMDEIKKNYN